MDIISSKNTISLIIRDLDINCVLLIELKDGTARHLVQETLVVLIIGEQNWIAVFIKCHQGISTIHMHVVGEVVNSWNLAGEQTCLRIIMLLCIVHNLIKLNWGTRWGIRCHSCSSECRHWTLDKDWEL